MTHNWVWKILLELFIEAKDQDQSCVLVDGPSMTAKEVLFSKPYRPAGLQAEIDKAVAKAIGESEWGSHHGKGQDGGSLKMRCETCTENVGNSFLNHSVGKVQTSYSFQYATFKE